MKIKRSALVYTALVVGAIAAIAWVFVADPASRGGSADFTAAADLRDGDMKKLNFHPEPRAVSDAAFVAEDGSEMTLAAFEGKLVVLNFWATWCAPCRKEMPMLEALQQTLGGDGFEVVTLATGRNNPVAMKKFFDEIGVTDLPLHRDPQSAVARDMAVLGLPATVILSPDGREIARLQGDADWSSDSARAVLRKLIDMHGLATPG